MQQFTIAHSYNKGETRQLSSGMYSSWRGWFKNACKEYELFFTHSKLM